MLEAIKDTSIKINEFTVAPQINPNSGLPYHEWFVEFDNSPEDLEAFSLKLDAALQKQNTYYFDLIQGKVLRPLSNFNSSNSWISNLYEGNWEIRRSK